MKTNGKTNVVDIQSQEAFRSVLIFGGAGFIGSNLTLHLLENTRAKVHIFDNLSRPGVRHNLEMLQRKAGNSGRLQITIGDIRNATLVQRAVKPATEIYHLAAQVAVTSSIDDPRFDFEVNLGGTINILEAARQSGRKPFLLFTSTNKVYGDLSAHGLIAGARGYRFADAGGVDESQPLDFHSPYGCSKGAADQYVRDYARVFGLPTVVFRMSCIAGPQQFGTEDQGWVAHFLYSALMDREITVYGDGRQVRDVLHVADLVRAMEAARIQQASTRGEVFNVGGGEANSISLLDLMAKVEAMTGRDLRYATVPARPADQLVYVTNFRKLEQHTGWKPQLSLDETLQQIHAWWRANQELFAPQPERASAPPVGLLQEMA